MVGKWHRLDLPRTAECGPRPLGALAPAEPARHGCLCVLGSDATAHFFAGDLDVAFAAVEKALTDWADAPPALRLKAAMCGLRGQIDEGRACVERLLARNPESTLEAVASFYGKAHANSPAVEDLLEGLRNCGLQAHGQARRNSPRRLH